MERTHDSWHPGETYLDLSQPDENLHVWEGEAMEKGYHSNKGYVK